MFTQVAFQEKRSLRHDLFIAPESRHPVFRSIVTADPEMEKIFHVIEKVAPTCSTVLICGESGTGKELIAKALHELSGCQGHFVPVNCGAIPDNLLESELFGYEKGAFTGAVTSKPGRFVYADGGTMFLDEIGEMSPHLQVKLLRVLQDKVVEPIGGVRSRPIQVRIIAATHVNLREHVRLGNFREDLFFRLQVLPIHIPALRNRLSDIPVLAHYFSHHCASQNQRKPLVFSFDALEIFRRYSWPGNVRELENLVERLTILCDSDVVYPSDLPLHLSEGSPGEFHVLTKPSLPEEGLDFNAAVEEFENTLILQALQRTNGNKKAAARLLNLNRTTLVEKIKKKGLEGFDDAKESVTTHLL